jgi:hypothetical protein
MSPGVAEVEDELEHLAHAARRNLGPRGIPHIGVLLVVGDPDRRSVGHPEHVQVSEVPSPEARVDRLGQLPERVLGRHQEVPAGRGLQVAPTA